MEIVDTKLYKSAFTHSTFNKKDNYERLEFLGDAILNSIVSEYLFTEFKNKDEGFYSKTRSNIVGRKNLNLIGKEILPSHKIQNKLKHISDNVFGNVLESIIGAVYLDLGYNTSKDFVIKYVIEKTNTKSVDQNYKSKILEWSQLEKKEIKFVNSIQKGPDHKKEYLIELFVDGNKISESWGNTIKSAEQKSAEIAIKIVS